VVLNSEIVIVGGGVLGLCTAAELTARGHDVVVLDPGGRSASSVAAGMIAPALESALDGVDLERAALLRDAAALWPDFADRMDIALRPGPAAWRGPEPERLAATLGRLGFGAEVRDGAVWTDDRQVEPEPALAALLAQVGRVVRTQALSVERSAGDWIVRTEMGSVTAPVLVLATGAAGAIKGLPRAIRARVEAIVPIRGQIGWIAVALTNGVVRGVGGYVAAMGTGAVMGASMGEGRRDLAVDAVEVEALSDVAVGLVGQAIDAGAIDWRVGIRGATADGLPMAGPSGEAGLYLALAPRRNGWLLGPLVARVVADGIEGREPGRHALALDPRRFSPPGY
jgi:glycine oxidase